MIVNYDTKCGYTVVRLESDRLDEVQQEVNRLHGRFKFIGPEKAGDKYIAIGMEAL